mmetsp:Transcript_55806/g.122247  ORF Transcript_55806/g.122247 Transcript_55806/m.122247 type:complete len:240 (-) Transcript_55806:164-883(-)
MIFVITRTVVANSRRHRLRITIAARAVVSSHIPRFFVTARWHTVESRHHSFLPCLRIHTISAWIVVPIRHPHRSGSSTFVPQSPLTTFPLVHRVLRYGSLDLDPLAIDGVVIDITHDCINFAASRKPYEAKSSGPLSCFIHHHHSIHNAAVGREVVAQHEAIHTLRETSNEKLRGLRIRLRSCLGYSRFDINQSPIDYLLFALRKNLICRVWIQERHESESTRPVILEHYDAVSDFTIP